MAETLNYDSLKGMKLSEFKKAFKEKTQWKKAKAAVFLIDYKIGGKKCPVVIPLRKTAELKPLIKQIKADKHPNNKIAAGFIQIVKTKAGQQANFTLTQGGYAPNALATKISPLFTSLLKLNFSVQTGSPEVSDSDETDASSAKKEKNTAPIQGDLSQKEKTTTAPSPPTESSENNIDAILPIFNKIKGHLKGNVKDIINRFKAKNNQMKDRFLLNDVASDINTFLASFEEMGAKEQKKMAPAKASFLKYNKTIQQVSTKLSTIDIPPKSDEEVEQMIARIEQKIEALVQQEAKNVAI